MRSALRWPPAAWGLALVVVLAALLRFSALAADYDHPDEVIPVVVAGGLLEAHSLDTNWDHADLPPFFRYPQYNFSGYILSAAAVLQARAWWPGGAPGSPLEWLRAWSALLGVGVVALTFVVGRSFFGIATGLLAAIAVAIHPLLFQDSLYARPETFVTLLTLVAIWLAGASARVRPERAFVAAFVVGVLIATKVSMLLLLPLLLIPLDASDARAERAGAGTPATRESPFGYAWARAYGLPAGVLLGFVAGVPYGLVHLADFIDGVQALRTQYSTGHWPHGLEEGAYLERLAYAGRYFRTTTGWLTLAAFVGAAVAALRRQWRPLAVFLVALLTAMQFATYQVFFERNLSHVVPVFAIFAAYALVAAATALAPWRALRTTLLVLLAGAMLWPSARTTATLRFHELAGVQHLRLTALRTRLERDLGVPAAPMPWSKDYELIRARSGFSCGPVLIELPSAEETRSRIVIDKLRRQDGFHEVGRLASAFARVPPSTLHTYFIPTTVFLYRGTDAEACWRQGGGLVPHEMAGERLPLRSVQADPGWTRGGAFSVPADPFGGTDYYGSWSGRDDHRGKLRLEVSVEASDFIVLPYRTGPTARHLTIRIIDGDTGIELLKAAPVKAEDWQLPAIRVPARTRTVIVEAIDDGAAWGEWLAVGMPRGLR